MPNLVEVMFPGSSHKRPDSNLPNLEFVPCSVNVDGTGLAVVRVTADGVGAGRR